MLVQSYAEMLKKYGLDDLNEDDKQERMEMLSKYRYSVIFEGEFLEYDNVEKWISLNIKTTVIRFLFYGKLSYDYGFFELFFDKEEYANKLSVIIPEMHITYLNGKTGKSNGYEEFIEIG